jgi:acyl carrier protein phosphodiesterase
VPRDGKQDYYFIPKGGDSDEWIKTNPKLDQALCKMLHDRHDKKLKPVIRLIKYWNQAKNAGRIRSYHLDVLIWKVFLSHPSKINTYPEGVKYFFDNVEQHLSVSCPDIWELSENVDSSMSAEDRQESVKKIQEIRSILATVNQSPLGGVLPPPISNKLAKWKKVFGDEMES